MPVNAKSVIGIVSLIVDRQCNDTDIRLVDGLTSLDGRVEVCLDGLWGSVCDHRWDYRDAAVVCKQLGYNGREFSSCYIRKLCLLLLSSSVNSASYPLLEHSNFNIFILNIHLDNVDCNGNESKLSECQHRGIGIHDCAEGVEEAGVICTGECRLICMWLG